MDISVLWQHKVPTIRSLRIRKGWVEHTVDDKVNKAIENYQNGSYSLAYNVLNEVLSENQFASDPRWKEIKVLAKQYMLQSAIALERPDAELAVITYIKEISPDLSAQALIINLAEYFYNKKVHDQHALFRATNF